MQKLIIIAALALFSLNYAEAKGNGPLSASWEEYKNYHAKMYVSDEHEANHKAAFDKNAADVAAHNAAYSQGKVSYTKELNKFADMDAATFQTRNGFKAPTGAQAARPVNPPNPLTVDKRALPASFDWRTTGKVSPVKDQGQCGSCWSFSANGALESQVLIKSNKSTSLSEQQLVSCDTGNNNNGCNGGMYTRAWNYIITKSKGVQTTAQYPYTSGGGSSGTCKLTSTSTMAQKMTSFKDLTNTITSDSVLMQALVTNGPISVAIDASDMQLASDKIYSCGTVKLDHAVLLVGYGTLNGKDYWIVKNSWGTGWGENGFFKMARGAGDCGITQWPAYPIL